MSLGLPQLGDCKLITNLATTGSATPGTTVTSGAANTYGSVTECISAANNTQESWGIAITAGSTALSATISGSTLDILVGGATDDVLISSLLVGWVFGGPNRSYVFPLHIPAGVRIAAQMANETTTRAAQVIIHLYGGSPPPWKTGNKVTTYGSKNNSARGQTVAPSQSGAAASVTQLTAASTLDHHYFIPGFEPYNDTTITDRNYSVGIGVGASTEERIGTWGFGFDAGEKGGGPWPDMGVFRTVLTGTRLTMLAANSGTNDTTYGGLIYAV